MGSVMPIRVGIKKVHEHAQIPQYQTAGAAGADLHACEPACIIPGATMVVNTGVVFDIPEGYEIQVRPRSGLAAKRGITVLNAPGTIDSDYTGLCKVILHNAGHSNFEVHVGDRIAQAVLKEAPKALFVEVDEVGESGRGAGGLGSTGT